MIAIGAILDLGFGVPHPQTYDFESLRTALLQGQDNWPNPRSAAALPKRNLSVARGTGVNRSHVLVRNGEGGDVIREMDANFRFAPITGTETDAVMQYDIRVGDARYDCYFAAGGDMFGIGNGRFSILRGGSLSTPTPLPKSVRVGDWLRLRLHVDFTAFDGCAAGTLEFANLTRGDVSFQAIPELTRVKLWTAKPLTPRAWKVLHINMRSPPDGFAIDNLVPNLASQSHSVERLLLTSAISLALCSAAAVLLARAS